MLFKKTAVYVVLLVIVIGFGSFDFLKKMLVTDLSVKKPIEILLNKFFWMEMSSNEEDCSNIVSDLKLAKVYNLKFKNLRKSNANKSNKKLKINIENIDEIETNKFIVNFKVVKEFTCDGSPDKLSTEDNYTSEVIKKDNKFYINKLIDYYDYVQVLDKSNILGVQKVCT